MTTKQYADVELKVNSAQARKQFAELEQKAAKLREKFADAVRVGDPEAVRRINTELQQVNKQMTNMQTNASNIRAAMKRLDEASPAELRKTIKYINSELNSGRVKRGSKEWEMYNEQLRLCQLELKKLQVSGAQTEGVFSRFNGLVNKWGASIAATTAAFAGVILSGKSAVEAYAEMEQEEANVRKYTGMTAEEVAKLNDEFKQLDTRTTRQDLNKLAQEAGRLGKTSQEDVLGFVRAADKINVALDDLGDGATLTLSKLTGIFGDEKIHGTEQSLLKVGSVINELSQNCSASAPYLAEFASRMGGVASQANMTIPQIMGFAAVLDTNNQKVEASSTALSQVIVRLYQDPAKYAKVAGLDVKEFSDLMKKDANAALLLFLDTLNKVGGMDKLSPMFKDMGETGSHAISALSTLAAKIKDVKSQQEEANKAYEEGTSVTAEFNVQNNTEQAGLEKARKKFNEVAVALGKELLPVMRHCISGTSMMTRTLLTLITFIKDHKEAIIVATAALVTYHTAIFVTSGRLKTLYLTQLAVVKSLTLTKGALTLLSPLWTIAVNGVQFFTNGMKVNIAMQRRWVKSMTAFKTLIRGFNPWVIGLTAAVVALGSAYVLMSKRQTAAQRDIQAAESEAARKTGERRGQIELLIATAKNEELSLDRRKRAIEKLNRMIPNYNAQLDETSRKYTANKDALDDYLDSLQKRYMLESMEGKIKDLSGEAADLNIKRDEIVKQKGKDPEGQRLANLAKQAKLISGGMAGSALITGGTDYDAQLKRVDNRLADINDRIKQIKESYNQVAKEFDKTTPVNEPEEEPEESPYNPGLSDKELKKLETESKKRIKAALDAVKQERDQAEAVNLASYSAGEKNYREYIEEKQRIEAAYYIKAKAALEKEGQAESDEYAALCKKQEEALAKHLTVRRQISAEAIEQEHKDKVNALTAMFYDPSSAIFQNEVAYREALFREDLDYMTRKRDLYEKGSKERYDIERQINDKIAEEQLRKQEETSEKLRTFQEKYNPAELRKAQMAAELAVIEELHKKSLISEENYQEALRKIKEEYRHKSTDDFYEAANEYDAFIYDLYTKINDVIESLIENGELNLDDWTEIAAAAAQVVGAIASQFSVYMNAERDVELAKIEERYDKEIEAAGNNTKKREKLEAEKEKEIAKVKNQYNKKAMGMEIAQAIAQTASNALGAYGAMVKIPAVGPALAAAAAAMATAAGMIQIATIRKQHQAEAAGYYAGGFTKRSNDNREEAGVVHANEFVANHQAVANPAISPVLSLLDHAQRNNTVARLTREDVSNAIGQGVGVSARGVMTAPEVVTVTAPGQDTSDKVAAALDRTAITIDRLNNKIDEGISSYVVMDGEQGFDNQYRRFQKLKNTPKR